MIRSIPHLALSGMSALPKHNACATVQQGASRDQRGKMVASNLKLQQEVGPAPRPHLAFFLCGALCGVI